MGRTKPADDERAKKRAKPNGKEDADDDSDCHSDSSEGSVSLIDSDEGELSNKPSPAVEVVSKVDPARKSSSSAESTRISSPGASSDSNSRSLTIKSGPQTFLAMHDVDTYKMAFTELNQQVTLDLDDDTAIKKLVDKHLKRLSEASTGVYDSDGNASQRLTKSGSVGRRYSELLLLDQAKYKLIQKGLKTIHDMMSAHSAYAAKVKNTVLKLTNSHKSVVDQLDSFKKDTAANAKDASAELQSRAKGKGVLTSVNDILEKLLHKHLHLQTQMGVLLEHKPYEDDLLDNLQLTKTLLTDSIAKSELDTPLQVQIDALKTENSAKDAAIISYAETIATLTASLATAQGSAWKEEASPPPRQIISAAQQKQNRADRLSILADHQDEEFAKFEDQEKAASPNFKKFKLLLKITMEASMRGLWNQHALLKVWSILMPDYPCTDTEFKHFHIRPEEAGARKVSKPYNAITDSETGHGYGTASGEPPGKDDTTKMTGQAMAAVTQQFRFLLENMKATKKECTSLCAQRDKNDLATAKQLQDKRWLSSGTGLVPIPFEKYNDFFASPPSANMAAFKNARHTQIRTQIQLFSGWDFKNKKPMYVQTDAIWYLYFVEKLTKSVHSALCENIRQGDESKVSQRMLASFLPVENYFFDETQSPPTDSNDPRKLRVARRGYAALLKIMSNECGPSYGTILSVGASFFAEKFNDPDIAYPDQCALRTLLKAQDVKWNIENNYPPAHLHKGMRKKWSNIDIKPLKRSQISYAEQKWVEYFTLNLTKLLTHSNKAHYAYLMQSSIVDKYDDHYTPLQNTPLVQAAFINWPSTTFQALVAEASALN